MRIAILQDERVAKCVDSVERYAWRQQAVNIVIEQPMLTTTH